MNSFNLCEIIMCIQIAIYWWCFVFETYVKICGGIQLWGENRLCLFFSETKKPKSNIFYPTNEHFYGLTKNWYNFLSPRQIPFCQKLLENMQIWGFHKLLISLVTSFKKSAKSVKKLQNTVVKMKKNTFFKKIAKKWKLKFWKFVTRVLRIFTKKHFFFSFLHSRLKKTRLF